MWDEIFAGLERLKRNRKFWGKLDADDSLFDPESDEVLEEGYSSNTVIGRIGSFCIFGNAHHSCMNVY
jgi:hypothetical protein